jgi:hypothetical protein
MMLFNVGDKVVYQSELYGEHNEYGIVESGPSSSDYYDIKTYWNSIVTVKGFQLKLYEVFVLETLLQMKEFIDRSKE